MVAELITALRDGTRAASADALAIAWNWGWTQYEPDPQPALVAQLPWPEADPALLVAESVTLAVQVLGKLRDTLTVAKGTDKATLESLALASDKVQRQIDGATPKRVIVVPDRLVNIVI